MAYIVNYNYKINLQLKYFISINRAFNTIFNKTYIYIFEIMLMKESVTRKAHDTNDTKNIYFIISFAVKITIKCFLKIVERKVHFSKLRRCQPLIIEKINVVFRLSENHRRVAVCNYNRLNLKIRQINPQHRPEIRWSSCNEDTNLRHNQSLEYNAPNADKGCAHVDMHPST